MLGRQKPPLIPPPPPFAALTMTNVNKLTIANESGYQPRWPTHSITGFLFAFRFLFVSLHVLFCACCACAICLSQLLFRHIACPLINRHSGPTSFFYLILDSLFVRYDVLCRFSASRSNKNTAT